MVQSISLRKLIHISGAVIPFFAGDDILGKNLTIGLLICGLIAYLFLEAVKQKISPSILTLVYREYEIKGFAVEPFSYLISVISLLTLSLFINETLCFAAIAILAAGDGAAGVIGRRYGKHRLSFNKNKSWEGSISGFIAASITGFYYAGPIAIAGSAFGMLGGAVSKPVSKHDNLAVPYAALTSMAAIQLIEAAI